jgi:ABC-type transporter Mla MlaB component
MPEATEAHRLVLDGALTIRNMPSIHSRVLGAVRRYQTIHVETAGATEVDLSFVQLLVAARRSAALEGKALSLTDPATGPVLDTLTRAGLLDPSNPDLSGNEAFWLCKEASDGKDHPDRG